MEENSAMNEPLTDGVAASRRLQSQDNSMRAVGYQDSLVSTIRAIDNTIRYLSEEGFLQDPDYFW